MLNTKTETIYNIINNEFLETSEDTKKNFSPIDSEVLVGEYQSSNEEDLNKAINAASESQKKWKKLPGVERGNYLYKVAEILEKRSHEIARTMTLEMGKTFPEALGETLRGVAILKYYAGEGLRKNGDVIPSSTNNTFMFTKRFPIGVVGLITPWNFPVAIPIWKIAPALIYGNTVVVKPASESAITTSKVIECFVEAQLPAGVINCITGSGSKLGPKLVSHPLIKAISFTGSENVGRQVGSIANQRGIKYQLEMGGKNPVIIHSDADLELAVNETINGAFKSSGQKCTATSKVIIHEDIYQKVTQMLIEKTQTITVGNGLEEGIWLGPCANKNQYDSVVKFIDEAIKEGANLLYGGQVLDIPNYENGYYLSPAIFENVSREMKIYNEEVFGPVIILLKYSNLEEAIAIANDSNYGLSSSIFTNNISNILNYIDEIESGLVRINAESAGVELQAPFGGMKNSSTGYREQGEAAKEFYTETKTIFIKG